MDEDEDRLSTMDLLALPFGFAGAVGLIALIFWMWPG